MRSRLLLTMGTMVAASASCAEGSPFVGSGGAGVGGSTTVVTTTGSSAGDTSSSTGSGSCETPCKLTSPQCGCASGQECTISAAMRVCQIAGTSVQGQACVGQDQCAAGLLCVGGGATGVCDMFCATDSDCSSLGGICGLTLSDGTPTGTIPNATLCSGNCNPTNAGSCPVPGTGCQVGQEPTGQMRWLTYCGSAGTRGSNKTCTSSSDCLPGYGCLNGGTSSDVCLQYCDASDPSACGGQLCSPLQDTTTNMPIVVNGIALGACP
jgi:hypothetical protein